MVTFLRDPATGLDRLALAHLPTRVEEAPRLAAEIGVHRLWIKREDLSGVALGGNKLRQLDFILAEAIRAGADTLVTTAGSQSNFCRSLAGAAARLGLRCHLHLRRTTDIAPVGNLLLDGIFGATVTFTDMTDPWDPAIAAELHAIAATCLAAGRRPVVVQLTGASAAIGVAGWVSGAAELAADFVRTGDTPEAMAVVCGSGLTLAGIALGFKMLGCPTRLFGVSAQQPAARLKPWIVAAAAEASKRWRLPATLSEADFDIIDSEIAPGYGMPSARSVAAVRLAGRSEGLVLDPIYSGKGLAGLMAGLDAGALRRGASLAFLHSGGTPGLFAHADAFATQSPPGL